MVEEREREKLIRTCQRRGREEKLFYVSRFPLPFSLSLSLSPPVGCWWFVGPKQWRRLMFH